FELEFIPRVQPGPQLPGLVRAATPQRAAGVAHAVAVEHTAARAHGVLTVVRAAARLLRAAESLVAAVPLLAVELHDPSSMLGDTLGRDRPSGDLTNEAASLDAASTARCNGITRDACNLRSIPAHPLRS